MNRRCNYDNIDHRSRVVYDNKSDKMPCSIVHTVYMPFFYVTARYELHE